MFHVKLEKDTINNTYYRHVIFTAKHMQLVLMSLKPGTNIPEEVHENHDQFIRIEHGNCKIITPEKTVNMGDGDAVIIPAGTKHEVINIGDDILKLYTIYSPPEHNDGLIQNGGMIQKKYMKYVNKNNEISLIMNNKKIVQ